MLRVSGVTDGGIQSKALIDMFPTITELAGLPQLCPNGNNHPLTCVEGTSVVKAIPI